MTKGRQDHPDPTRRACLLGLGALALLVLGCGGSNKQARQKRGSCPYGKRKSGGRSRGGASYAR